jgi:hypothetical protein
MINSRCGAVQGPGRTGCNTDLEPNRVNISRRLEDNPLRVTRGPPGGTNEAQGLRLAGIRVIVLSSCGQRRAVPQGKKRS